MKAAIAPQTDEPTKQVLLHLNESSVKALDRAAKERGMSRNAFIVYLAKAIEMDLVMISDPSTYGKWKQEELNQVTRTARVAARKETMLCLHEQGFVTGPYQR